MKTYNLKAKKPINRSQSLTTLSPYLTIAQFNKVSKKILEPTFHINKPLRITIPQFFNVPGFVDDALSFTKQIPEELGKKIIKGNLKQRMKDLHILAQGMKRAKNIKQQSRYYYIQAVLMHNARQYEKAIDYFNKFLKIVLFIKDEKSIELALNCIGNSYMYLNNQAEAIQYHQKPLTIVPSPDAFVSLVNIGMCYEMSKNHSNAYNQYQKAQNILEKQQNTNPNKQRLIQQLLERVENRIEDEGSKLDVFMTENVKKTVHQKALAKKNFQNKTSKILYLQRMQHSPTQREYQHAKIGYSVSKAQQKLSKFMRSLKVSFAESDSSDKDLQQKVSDQLH